MSRSCFFAAQLGTHAFRWRISLPVCTTLLSEKLRIASVMTLVTVNFSPDPLAVMSSLLDDRNGGIHKSRRACQECNRCGGIPSLRLSLLIIVCRKKTKCSSLAPVTMPSRLPWTRSLRLYLRTLVLSSPCVVIARSRSIFGASTADERFIQR